MEALALGTKAENFFYHANINPRDDEHLTEEQWDKAIDTLEHNLGLDGHSRFVVEHEKHGRAHRHVVWSRIDVDSMTAVSDSKTYAIHMRTADELEKAFDHERTPRGHGPDGPNPKNYEVFRGKESGIDAYDFKAEISALWRQADTGQAFAAALEEHGYVLARGDRRDFVVVDPAGDDHALGRRSVGVTAAEIRSRMAELDRAALPTVEEARALARERAETRGRISEADPSRPQADPAPRRDEPGALDLVAETVTEAVREAVAEKEPPTAFDRLAQDIVREAHEAAPVVQDVATATALVEPELSAFERFAQGSKESLRAVGEGLFIAEGIAWLAKKLGAPSQSAPLPDHEATAFATFAHETKEAMRENGGEPATGFWQRSINLLAAARDRAVEWVRESAQRFVGLVTRTRNRDHESGIER
jgi:Relaxase/Mobilisation nuclease domain